MADDTNIDDILRSIDALLKESEPDEGHKRAGGFAAGATNDDDLTEASDEACEERETDDQPVEEASSNSPDAGDVSGDESAQQDEAHESGGNQDEVVLPLADEAGIDEGEQDSVEIPEDQPVAKGRRIMLSEAMQVDDSLDLPLKFSAHSDAQADDGQGPATVFVDSEDEDESLSVQSGPVDEEGGAPAAMDATGLNDLIESISADIQARLSRELPLLLAPLIEQSVKQHLERLGKSPDAGEEIDE